MSSRGVPITNKDNYYTQILKDRLSETFRGESQEVTAHRLNTVQSNISKWKNGIAVPTVDVLVHISKAYNVSIDWLLGFSDKKTIDAIKYDDLTYEHVARIFDYLLDTGTIAILEQSTKSVIDDVEVDDCFVSDEDLDEQTIDREKEQQTILDPNCIEIKDRAVSFILRQRYKIKELEDDDTFLSDQHPTMKADYVMANPPFNLTPWGAEKLKEDQRWKYGTPPASNANFAWMQHMIWHLAPEGKIGMVLANGALTSEIGGENVIRANIIDADLVDCIVSLPDRLFYTTGIPVSLWFLNKKKSRPGHTLFIDARNLGTMVSKRLRELTDFVEDNEKGDIQIIADTYKAYVNGTLEDKKGFCATVTTDDIKNQGYVLTPGRYVGIEEQKEDEEPFEAKMTRLTSEISGLFAKSHELEEEIIKNLGAIGYEIKPF